MIRSHALRNALHTVVLVGAMGGLAWVTLDHVLGPRAMTLLFGLAGISLLVSLVRPRRMRLPRGTPIERLDRTRFPLGADLMERLSRRAGLRRPPALYRVKSDSLNAMAVGGGRKSAVVITDTLLAALGPRELEAILAHEIAHIAHRDLRVLDLAARIGGLLAVAGRLGILLLLLSLGAEALGMRVFGWETYVPLLLAPLLGGLLQRGLSRVREFDADRGALALTQDPKGLIAALNTLGPGQGGLRDTHPSRAARIARIRRIAQKQPGGAGDVHETHPRAGIA